MSGNSSEFNIPSFARKPAYNFDPKKESLKIYQELSKISEEIEECRQRNI
ncbi:hypothetical protein IKF57_01185 [Candidatus Saccharibacteria bacterium]|nr:hypothetical protein [Candidatus Saccharibacteria bacterium]